MLLANKNAVVYRGEGEIGDTGDRAFAREGAKAFHAARTISKVEAVAEEIRSTGERRDAAEILWSFNKTYQLCFRTVFVC